VILRRAARSLSVLLYFFYSDTSHRVLHSFPTRRSSDLKNLRARPGTDRCSGRSFVGQRSGGAGNHAFAAGNAGESAHRRVEIERSEEHTSELQSPDQPVCRLLLEKKKTNLQINKKQYSN